MLLGKSHFVNTCVLSGIFISKQMCLILSHGLILQLPSREKCDKRMSYKAEKLNGAEGKYVKDHEY